MNARLLNDTVSSGVASKSSTRRKVTKRKIRHNPKHVQPINRSKSVFHLIETDLRRVRKKKGKKKDKCCARCAWIKCKGSRHSWIYSMLNHKSHRPQASVYRAVFLTIVVSDLVAFLLSTLPDMQSKSVIFYYIEAVVSSIFLLEYSIRFFTITESKAYGRRQDRKIIIRGLPSHTKKDDILLLVGRERVDFDEDRQRLRLNIHVKNRFVPVEKQICTGIATVIFKLPADADNALKQINSKTTFLGEEISARSARVNPCIGRLRYLVTMWALLDAIATFPFFVELALTQVIPDSTLPTLTVIRIFSLFRVMRAENYARCFSSAHRVLWMNAHIFVIALTLCLTLVLFTSVLLFYVRPYPEWYNQNGYDNSSFTQFQSLPDTAYLSILMLTGQGQPDGPLPWFTKIIVCINALISVGLFAVMASMLTWGFEQEAERLLRKDIIQRRRAERGLPSQEKIPTLSEVSTSSSDTGGDSLSSEEEANREYESIIVEEADICGGDDEDEGEEMRLSELAEAIDQQGKFLQTLMQQQAKFQQQLGVIVQSIPKVNT